jgi:MFS family permease
MQHASPATTPPVSTPRKPFGVPLAWWIALGATLGVCFGFSSFVATVFGQFVRPISTEFGWTRTQTTGALTLATLLTIAGAPIAGALIDRFGPRLVLLVASLLLPLAVASLSLTDGGLPRYYLTLAMIAVIGAGTLPGTYTAIVFKWFDRRRGLGFGFPLAGVGLSGIFLPPVIRSLIAAYDWHVAILIIGAAMFVAVVPMACFLFRLSPRNASEIDGGMAGPAQTEAPVAAEPSGVPWQPYLRSRQFLQLAASFILLGIATLGVIINFQAMLEDGGIPALTVAKLLSLQGLFTLIFRLGSGWLLDRFPPRLVSAVMIVAPALGITIIAVTPTLPMLIVAAPLLALGFGGEFNVMSFFSSRYFDRAAYGKMYGLIYATYTVGGSIGPILLAKVYDLTGAYRYGLLFMASLIVIASVLIITLPRLPAETGCAARVLAS